MTQYLFYYICGFITATASMPFSTWLYSIIGTSALFSISNNDKKLFIFFIWNIGYLSFSLSWFFPSMSYFLDANIISVSIFFVLSIIGLSILHSFPILLYKNRFRPSQFHHILIAINLIIMCEIIRSEILYLSWGGMGLSFIYSPLSWVYAYIGQYSVIAMVFIFAWLLIYRSTVFLWCISVLVLIGYLNHEYTSPYKEKLVALIQGPISMNANTEQFYKNHTQELSGSTLILWPETTLDSQSFFNKKTFDYWESYLNKKNQAMIAGVRILDSKKFYNAAIGLGHSKGLYYKHSLVPFGEITPFKYFLQKILNLFHIRLGSYSFPPNHFEPIKVFDYYVNTFICYDIGFQRLNEYMSKKSTMNVILNNEYWFPNSIQPLQLSNYVRLISLQTQKPSVAVSVEGPSMILNHKGEVIEYLHKGNYDVLSNNVLLYEGNTPWALYSTDKWFMIVMNIFLIGYFINGHRKQRFIRRSIPPKIS